MAKRRAMLAALPAAPAAPLSQKSRSAAIFGSPVFSAQSNGSLLSFRPREGAAATDRAEKSCAMRIRRLTLFAVFGTALRSIQDPSTDARDDKDGFCFQRSFDARGLTPRLLRMTYKESPPPLAPRRALKMRAPLFRHSPQAAHATFPQGGRQGSTARRSYICPRALARGNIKCRM